ncbi:MAG TPA: hypothetical protein VII94_02450 [Candidatus Saccharimonadales bacterium]
MSDKKPDNKQDITTDMLMADVMLRITAMEKILIDKGVFSVEELQASTKEIAERVTKVVMEKAASSKNLEEFISKLEIPKKDMKN